MTSRRRRSSLVASLALAASLLLAPGVAVAAPAAPTVTVTRTTHGYHVSWSAVSGATGYRLYYDRLTSLHNNGGGGESFGSAGKHLSRTVGAGTRSADLGDTVFALEQQSWYGENIYVVAYNASGSSPYGRGYAPCAPGYFLAARGSGQNPSSTSDNGFAYGLGSRAYRVYEDARLRLHLSRAQLQAEAVLYPAIPVSAAIYSGGSIYNSSVQAGANATYGLVARIASHCSRSRILMFGYSQGADVVGDAFALTSYRSRITQAQLFADADRYRGDTAIQYRPQNAASHGIHGTRRAFPGVTDRLQITSWCAEDDDVCSVDSFPSTFHGPKYDCYEKWAAESVAARARNTGWISSADMTHPTCTLQP